MKIETTREGASHQDYIKRVREGDTWRCYTTDEIGPEPTPGLPALPWRDFLDMIEDDLGIRDAVDAYLATAPRRAQDEFNRTLSFERDHPLLVAAIAALKLDPAAVDAAWRAQAAKDGLV